MELYELLQQLQELPEYMLESCLSGEPEFKQTLKRSCLRSLDSEGSRLSSH
jgi:hypothetical protein